MESYLLGGQFRHHEDAGVSKSMTAQRWDLYRMVTLFSSVSIMTYGQIGFLVFFNFPLMFTHYDSNVSFSLKIHLYILIPFECLPFHRKHCTNCMIK